MKRSSEADSFCTVRASGIPVPLLGIFPVGRLGLPRKTNTLDCACRLQASQRDQPFAPAALKICF